MADGNPRLSTTSGQLTALSSGAGLDLNTRVGSAVSPSSLPSRSSASVEPVDRSAAHAHPHHGSPSTKRKRRRQKRPDPDVAGHHGHGSAALEGGTNHKGVPTVVEKAWCWECRGAAGGRGSDIAAAAARQWRGEGVWGKDERGASFTTYHHHRRFVSKAPSTLPRCLGLRPPHRRRSCLFRLGDHRPVGHQKGVVVLTLTRSQLLLLSTNAPAA